MYVLSVVICLHVRFFCKIKGYLLNFLLTYYSVLVEVVAIGLLVWDATMTWTVFTELTDVISSTEVIPSDHTNNHTIQQLLVAPITQSSFTATSSICIIQQRPNNFCSI